MSFILGMTGLHREYVLLSPAKPGLKVYLSFACMAVQQSHMCRIKEAREGMAAR
jgi:hypothetical protein